MDAKDIQHQDRLTGKSFHFCVNEKATASNLARCLQQDPASETLWQGIEERLRERLQQPLPESRYQKAANAF